MFIAWQWKPIKMRFEHMMTVLSSTAHWLGLDGVYVSENLNATALKAGVRFNLCFYNNLINLNACLEAFCIAGLGEEALALCDERRNFSADIQTYITLMNCFAHCVLTDYGTELYKALKGNSKFVLPIKFYRVVIDLYSKAKRYDEAFKVIDEMDLESNNWKPVRMVFEHMMTVLSSTAHWLGLDGVYGRNIMCKDACVVYKNIEHKTVNTLNACLEAFCIAGLSEEALTLCDERRNFSVDIQTYITMMNYFAHCGLTDYGTELYKALNGNTFCIVGLGEEALALCDERQNFSADIQTYITLMNCFAHCDLTDYGTELYKALKGNATRNERNNVVDKIDRIIKDKMDKARDILDNYIGFHHHAINIKKEYHYGGKDIEVLSKLSNGDDWVSSNRVDRGGIGTFTEVVKKDQMCDVFEDKGEESWHQVKKKIPKFATNGTAKLLKEKRKGCAETEIVNGQTRSNSKVIMNGKGLFSNFQDLKGEGSLRIYDGGPDICYQFGSIF
ncbi:hypothetical protein Q3G72_020096 [Acer saccharum]|nr:hypothetical protein Q3G72_020096 [Acer saccharum]